MLTRWDAERKAAHQSARIMRDGPGRLGLRRAAVARAAGQLTDWANRWRSHLPDLPAGPSRIAQVAGELDNRPALEAALDITARRAAEDAHPEHATLRLWDTSETRIPGQSDKERLTCRCEGGRGTCRLCRHRSPEGHAVLT